MWLFYKSTGEEFHFFFFFFTTLGEIFAVPCGSKTGELGSVIVNLKIYSYLGYLSDSG